MSPDQGRSRVNGNGSGVSASDIRGATDERLSCIASLVHQAVAATEQRGQDGGLDGDLAARLIEVSHALHRAALALGDGRPSGQGEREHRLARSGSPRTVGADSPRVLSDRDRITEDLHDATVHRIFGAGLALHAALELVTDPRATEKMHQAIGLLDESVRHIRLVVMDLNAPDGR